MLDLYLTMSLRASLLLHFISDIASNHSLEVPRSQCPTPTPSPGGTQAPGCPTKSQDKAGPG